MGRGRGTTSHKPVTLPKCLSEAARDPQVVSEGRASQRQGGEGHELVLGALRAKVEIKSTLPPGSGPESAQNNRFPKENNSPDPPPDPPGRGETRTKQKGSLKTAGTTRGRGFNWSVEACVGKH